MPKDNNPITEYNIKWMIIALIPQHELQRIKIKTKMNSEKRQSNNLSLIRAAYLMSKLMTQIVTI